MASGIRGRGGRGRGRGGRPTIGGQQVSWDFNDKAIDSHEAQNTFFPDIEIPDVDPPTARELRMVDQYMALRKGFHNDLRQLGWPIDSFGTHEEASMSTRVRKDPFNAFSSYSQNKYQKRAHEARSVVKIKWDPRSFQLQHFPKSLRKVIDPTYDVNTDSTATTRGTKDGRASKKRRIIEDDDDEEDEAKKGDDDDQEERDLEDEDAEEPDPDETFSQDDEEMAGDYGDNYFETGEDDDDFGGGADEGGGGDDYE